MPPPPRCHSSSLLLSPASAPSALRRRFLKETLALAPLSLTAPLLLGLPQAAHAGGQLEEPLADSVRSALQFAIARSAPPVPVFTDDASRAQYEKWLSLMGASLQRRIPSERDRIEFCKPFGMRASALGWRPRWCWA